MKFLILFPMVILVSCVPQTATTVSNLYGPAFTVPPGRHGGFPTSCSIWEASQPLQPITGVVTNVEEPVPPVQPNSGEEPKEAFDVANASQNVQNFVAGANTTIAKFNSGWRPSESEITQRVNEGYTNILPQDVSSGSFLANSDVDGQLIDQTFVSYVQKAIQFIDDTTENEKTISAEQRGERPYYLVRVSTLNDNRGQINQSFQLLTEVKPPFARAGCERQATLARTEPLIVIGRPNPYTKITYGCWTEQYVRSKLW